jgi:hypothetical protein
VANLIKIGVFIMILKNAVLEAQEKYFKNAVTDSDYMTCVMNYYKEHLHIIRMSIGGFQTELNRITQKYANKIDDESTLKWSREVEALFRKKKVIKSNNFRAIEYLAVTYIAGSRGTSSWAKLMED